jgi:hypothetical protein
VQLKPNDGKPENQLRFDHGVRELQLREGQQQAQDARVDQFVNLGVHILHSRIRQHDRGGV